MQSDYFRVFDAKKTESMTGLRHTGVTGRNEEKTASFPQDSEQASNH